jgi:hypothetical protein
MDGDLLLMHAKDLCGPHLYIWPEVESFLKVSNVAPFVK